MFIRLIKYQRIIWLEKLIMPGSTEERLKALCLLDVKSYCAAKINAQTILRVICLKTKRLQHTAGNLRLRKCKSLMCIKLKSRKGLFSK